LNNVHFQNTKKVTHMQPVDLSYKVSLEPVKDSEKYAQI